MKALKTLTHHHHPSPPPSPLPATQPPPTLLNRALIATHFQDNQPPLPTAHFSSFANDASALAHGVAHPPAATYFPLIPSPPLDLSRVQHIVRSQVPELEAFQEESATIAVEKKRRSGVVREAQEEEVKVVRIRGSVRGWWTVLQGVLDDEEGGAWFLKRVRVRGEGREVEAYRATLHFGAG